MSDSTTSQKRQPAPKKLEQIVTEKAGALSPEDSVQTAGDRMRSHDAENWPVSEGRKLVGMVNEANPDLQAAGHGHDPNLITVGENMCRDVIYCYEDQDCAEALKTMDEHSLSYLPVVDHDLRIVGILSRGELEEDKPVPKADSEERNQSG